MTIWRRGCVHKFLTCFRYRPTFFAVAGQFLGLGPVAPIFYFLCIVFGPTASDLAESSPQCPTIWRGRSIRLLLIVLLFHTLEAFAMFLASGYRIQHFWTWAWQLTPLWIGVFNVVVGQIIGVLHGKNSRVATPKPILVVLGLVSSSVWIYTLLYCPHSLSTIFIPEGGVQTEFIQHTRKALQADELGVFSSSILWLTYSFFDLHAAGFIASEWLFYTASLPIVTLCVGPGAAFVIGWWMRENVLESALKS